MKTVQLSATEEAFVAMVLDEHKGAVQLADARRDARMKVLLQEKQIPDGVKVNIDKPDASKPAQLAYDAGPVAA